MLCSKVFHALVAVHVSQACIEAPLVAALDGESEPTASAQIRQTLTALLVTTAPQKPGYWIRLLGSVALATAPPVAAVAAGSMLAAAGGGYIGCSESMLHHVTQDCPVFDLAFTRPVTRERRKCMVVSLYMCFC